VAEQTLRASEINQFVYCRRAWWYARQGHPSSNLEMQLLGTQWHQRHGRTVLSAGCLRLLGYIFLLAAVVAAAVYLTTLIMS
jgi:hypothetical protein